MGKTESRLNKWIMGAVIWSAVIGLTGFSMSPKGKSFRKRAKRKVFRGIGFLQRGYAAMKNEFIKSDKNPSKDQD